MIWYHITPNHITWSHHIASHHIHHITSHITSHHIIYHIISYCIVPYHIISYHIISYHISHHITSHHIISYHIISYQCIPRRGVKLVFGKWMLIRTFANISRIHSMNVYILTHWSRVTHICVSKLTTIGSDNGLSPGRRQAIIWTNDGILLIRTLGTNFSKFLSEIVIFIQENASENGVCEMASISSRPQWVNDILPCTDTYRSKKKLPPIVIKSASTYFCNGYSEW